MPIVFLIVALGGLGVAGAALLVRGWIGRRVDDHPLCRRCGFDLIGRPATSIVCAECGAGLSGLRAIVVGHRRRGAGMLGWGITLLALCLTGAGGVVALRARGVNWISCEPTWWLLRRAISRSDANSAELIELQTRLMAGRLTAGQMVELEEAALTVQADASVPWQPAWGNVLESAMMAGKLSPQRLDRYAQQALASARLNVQFRARVRHGDPLPFTCRAPFMRCGNRVMTPLLLASDYVVLSWGQSSRRLVYFGQEEPLDGALLGYMFGSSVSTHDMAVGNFKGQTESRVSVIVPSQGNRVLATAVLKELANFVVLPGDRPSVELKTDAASAAKVAQTLGIQERPTPAHTVPNLSITISSVPLCTDVSYRVLVRGGPGDVGGVHWPGGTYQVGSVTWPAGAYSCAVSMGQGLGSLASATVDVLFEPDVGQAANTMDIFHPCGTAMIVRDVPWLAAAGRGAFNGKVQMAP